MKKLKNLKNWTIWNIWKIDKYLTGEEIFPPNQSQVIEQTKFAHSPLGKVLEKQKQKQIGTLKSLDTSNEENELKQIEFYKIWWMILFVFSWKKSLIWKIFPIKIFYIINQNVEKLIILVNIHYLLFFLRDTHKRCLPLEDADYK